MTDEPSAAPPRVANPPTPAAGEAGGSPQLAIAVIVGGVLALLAVQWLLARVPGGAVTLQRDFDHNGDYLIDVNQAAAAELALLPAIGPALAQRIIDLRQMRGPFRSLDELNAVRGIGPKTLAKIRPWLKPFPAEARAAPTPSANEKAAVRLAR